MPAFQGRQGVLEGFAGRRADPTVAHALERLGLAALESLDGREEDGGCAVDRRIDRAVMARRIEAGMRSDGGGPPGFAAISLRHRGPWATGNSGCEPHSAQEPS